MKTIPSWTLGTVSIVLRLKMENLRSGVARVRRLDNQLFETEDRRTLMSKNKIASIALGAIYGRIVPQHVFRSIIPWRMIVVHPPITTDDLHLEFSWLNLTISPILEAPKFRVCLVRVELPSLGSTIVLSLA
jgi:hypothetical protein